MNWADSDWVCKAKPLLIEGLLVWEELGSMGELEGHKQWIPELSGLSILSSF